MVDLTDYDKLEKVALRNMTVMELIEKLSKREEVVREHYDKVVDKNDSYPRGDIEEMANSIAMEKIDGSEYSDKEFEDQLALLTSNISSGLTDMMDDLYLIRTQIRQRLYAMGQTLYTDEFDGDKVEDVLAEQSGLEEEVEKLKKHGHDGEIKTDTVVTPE